MRARIPGRAFLSPGASQVTGQANSPFVRSQTTWPLVARFKRWRRHNERSEYTSEIAKPSWERTNDANAGRYNEYEEYAGADIMIMASIFLSAIFLSLIFFFSPENDHANPCGG